MVARNDADDERQLNELEALAAMLLARATLAMAETDDPEGPDSQRRDCSGGVTDEPSP